MYAEFLKNYGTWRDVADAARTTIGMEEGKGVVSTQWKRKILLAEHSPIRKLYIGWKWYELPWFVQTHFTRHYNWVHWFVSTSREDRTGVKRGNQDDPVILEGHANQQEIITISRKRLCSHASKETRDAWLLFLDSIKYEHPELVRCCVPDCVYRGWCYEMQTCGYFKTKAYEEQLADYRKGIHQDEM